MNDRVVARLAVAVPTLALLFYAAPVQGLSDGQSTSEKPPQAEAPEVQDGAQEAMESKQDDDEPAWPGSFGVLDSETRFKVGGFAQFDFIYDSDEIFSRCEFITSTIATDGGTGAGGSNGRTSYCVNATRLTLESRTPTKLGRLTTFVSIDLFGDPNAPTLRLRQAYGELIRCRAHPTW